MDYKSSFTARSLTAVSPLFSTRPSTRQPPSVWASQLHQSSRSPHQTFRPETLGSALIETEPRSVKYSVWGLNLVSEQMCDHLSESERPAALWPVSDHSQSAFWVNLQGQISRWDRCQLWWEQVKSHLKSRITFQLWLLWTLQWCCSATDATNLEKCRKTSTSPSQPELHAPCPSWSLLPWQAGLYHSLPAWRQKPDTTLQLHPPATPETRVFQTSASCK